MYVLNSVIFIGVGKSIVKMKDTCRAWSTQISNIHAKKMTTYVWKRDLMIVGEEWTHFKK